MAEYIDFKHRDWGYRGDKQTWARREDDGSITVQRSPKGIISEAYTQEMKEFCAKYGFDFSSLKPGDKVTLREEE